MEAMEEKFTLKQVCEMLDEKAYNLKYLEKMIGLSIERDIFSHKFYTQNDIEIIKRAKVLKKEKGVHYEEIKNILLKEFDMNRGNEILTGREIIIGKENIDLGSSNDTNAVSPKSIEKRETAPDEVALEIVKSDIVDLIIEKLRPIIDAKFDDLQTSIKLDMEFIIKQNSDMKTNVELEIEKYFNDIDTKIDGLANSRSSKSRGLLKKLF